MQSYTAQEEGEEHNKENHKSGDSQYVSVSLYATFNFLFLVANDSIHLAITSSGKYLRQRSPQWRILVRWHSFIWTEFAQIQGRPLQAQNFWV